MSKETKSTNDEGNCTAGAHTKGNARQIKELPKLHVSFDELISKKDSNLTVNEIIMISELLAEARGEL